MNFCSPALLYLILSVFSILLAVLMNVLPVLIISKLVFTLLWTWFLNFLCVKGYKTVSWILVLLPFIIIMLQLMVELTDNMSEYEEGLTITPEQNQPNQPNQQNQPNQPKWLKRLNRVMDEINQKQSSKT